MFDEFLPVVLAYRTRLMEMRPTRHFFLEVRRRKVRSVAIRHRTGSLTMSPIQHTRVMTASVSNRTRRSMVSLRVYYRSLNQSKWRQLTANFVYFFLLFLTLRYTWHSVPSIMYRQNGFSIGKKKRHTVDTPYNFQAGVRGSLHAVERLEQMSKLSGHFGCINCINFNQSGTLLASGSDDLTIKIWNWSRKKVVTNIKTSSTGNIFQAKFIDYNGYDSGFDLVSSDQCGGVRHYSIGPCGSLQSEKLLHGSPRAVHKLGLPANRPYEVLSAGEDSRVMLIDLREGSARRLFRAKCSLYTIACHPLNSNEFCVGGQDQYVLLYDRRSVKSAVRVLCPEHLMNVNCLHSHAKTVCDNETIFVFSSLLPATRSIEICNQCRLQLRWFRNIGLVFQRKYLSVR